jgi:hypothetical protein
VVIAKGASKGCEPYLLPLVIGVTGHRDLREEHYERLRSLVIDFFNRLRAYYPSTPLVLISPLAEGADRLVAKVALDAFPDQVRLVVPLPMPKALYEADCSTAESRLEFNELFGRADPHDRFELPLLGGPRGGLRQSSDVRDRQYAQAGVFVVRHSQILLALWDGKDTGQVGGTSQIVSFQRDGVPEPYAPPPGPLELPERGALYHIVTPRVSGDDQPDERFAVREYFPDPGGGQREDVDAPKGGPGHAEGDNKGVEHDGGAEQVFRRILLHVDGFNRDVRRLAPKLAQEWDATATSLLGAVDRSTLPAPLEVTLERYAKRFAVADAMANHFKRLTIRTLKGLFGLVFAAVVFFHLYAHLGKHWPFLVLYLAVLLGAYGWYLWVGDIPSPYHFLERLVGVDKAQRLWARRGQYKRRYLDYRALAEGLRVQFFWLLADVPDSPADHYLHNQRSELDWIRSAFRSWDAMEYGTRRKCLQVHTGFAGHLADPSAIMEHWAGKQRHWYAYRTYRDHWAHVQNKRHVVGLLFTGALLAGLLLLLPQLLQVTELPEGERELLPDLLIILASLAPALAAILAGYAEKMAYSEEVKQYERMRGVFELAARQLSASLQQPAEVRRVLRALGQEALAEHGEWVLLQRGRPVDVPRGG